MTTPLIVVLGASGMLGTAVTRELATRPVRLRLVGRRRPAVPRGCHAEVMTADLTQPGALTAAVSDADAVIHLVARITGPATWRVADGDSHAERVNLGLVHDLIDVVRTQRRSRPPVVLFAGSMSQTGRNAVGRIDGSEPQQPLTAYDRQKMAAEQALKSATIEGVVRAITLRLATLFSQGTDPGVHDVGVVATMLRRAFAGQSLTMWHDGSVKRDLLCVDDAARAFLAAWDHADDLVGEHWLVGTGQATSVAELFTAIARAAARSTGRPAAPVVSVDPAEHAAATDLIDFVLDPSAFTAASGWTARIPLSEGLSKAAANWNRTEEFAMPVTSRCRVCDNTVELFLDLGRQPLSDAFVDPDDRKPEFFYQLATGICGSCTMVQLMAEVPRERMFHEAYPYLSSGSSFMREHFERLAQRLLTTELAGADPFIVELGCNDGIMLRALAQAGIRHLGVEPSGGVADLAAAKGIRVRKNFFEESSAAGIAATDGRADVIFAANTLCHIPYIGSILRGVRALLAPSGVFLFEDPYLGDIVERTSFDQIYDEHFFLFTARSVKAMAKRYGLELVDVERLSVHGGEVRYTLAWAGARTPSPAVAKLLAWEGEQRLADRDTLVRFSSRVQKIRVDLLTLLRQLKADGKRVAGYGATAKSATVLNYCGIGPDLVEFVSDTSPTKQGRLTPGSHIPVHERDRFAAPYPDYALLFAWNHAAEIMAKEHEFRDAGGQWIRYVPDVRIG